MIIGHLPAGYVISKLLARYAEPLGVSANSFLWAGVNGALAPDLDMFYFHFVDHRHHHHHTYFTHYPIVWLVLLAASAIWLYAATKKSTAAYAAIFSLNSFAHMFLDTIVGDIWSSIKLDVEPGQRYISRIRSNDSQPIQDVFHQINTRVEQELQQHPEYIDNVPLQKKHIPYIGELFLGHVRYGTFGKNNIESVHPFLRQNNWMHRNHIVAGNFNMTNVKQLFDSLVAIGQHPKEMADTVTVMEKIGHFLDEEVTDLYFECKNKGLDKKEASGVIIEKLNIQRILKRASKNWDGGYAIAGLLGHGDAFVFRDPAGIRPAYYYEDEEIVVVASERP